MLIAWFNARYNFSATKNKWPEVGYIRHCFQYQHQKIQDKDYSDEHKHCTMQPLDIAFWGGHREPAAALCPPLYPWHMLHAEIGAINRLHFLAPVFGASFSYHNASGMKISGAENKLAVSDVNDE